MNNDKQTIILGRNNPFFPSAAVLMGTGDIGKRYLSHLNKTLSVSVSGLANAMHPVLPGNPAFVYRQCLAWLDLNRDKHKARVTFNGLALKDMRRLHALCQAFLDFLTMNEKALEDVSYLVNPRPMNLDAEIPQSDLVLPVKDMDIVDAEIINLEPLPTLPVDPAVMTIEQTSAYSKPVADLVPGDVGYFEVKA